MRQNLRDFWRQRIWSQEKKDSRLEVAVQSFVDAGNSNVENKYEAIQEVEDYIRIGADAQQYEHLFDHMVNAWGDQQERKKYAEFFEAYYPNYTAMERFGDTDLVHPSVKKAKEIAGPDGRDGNKREKWVLRHANAISRLGIPGTVRKKVLEVAEGKDNRPLKKVEKELLSKLEEGIDKAWNRENMPALQRGDVMGTTLTMSVSYLLKGVAANKDREDMGLTKSGGKITWENFSEGQRTVNDATNMLKEAGIKKPVHHLIFLQIMAKHHPSVLSIMNGTRNDPNKIALIGSSPLFISFAESHKELLEKDYLQTVFKPQKAAAAEIAKDLRKLLKTLDPHDIDLWFDENHETLSEWEEKLLGYAQLDYQKCAASSKKSALAVKASLERVSKRLEVLSQDKEPSMRLPMLILEIAHDELPIRAPLTESQEADIGMEQIKSQSEIRGEKQQDPIRPRKVPASALEKEEKGKEKEGDPPRVHPDTLYAAMPRNRNVPPISMIFPQPSSWKDNIPLDPRRRVRLQQEGHASCFVGAVKSNILRPPGRPVSQPPAKSFAALEIWREREAKAEAEKQK